MKRTDGASLRDLGDGVLCVELMLTTGWHGTQAVNPVRESLRLRDVLKAARDAGIRSS